MLLFDIYIAYYFTLQNKIYLAFFEICLRQLCCQMFGQESSILRL